MYSFPFIKLYKSKKNEHNEATAKLKQKEENNNNNGDDSDEKPVEKTIFIERIVKLALEEKIFTDDDVMSELKTILLAVGIRFLYHLTFNVMRRLYGHFFHI